MINESTIAVILSNPRQAEAATKLFLKLGLKSKVYQNCQSAYEEMQNKKYDYIFLDFDFANNEALTLIKKLYEKLKLENSHLLATSINVNQDLLKDLMEYQLVGFIVKPLSAEKINQKMTQILEKYQEGFHEKRKHVRITPPQQDMIQASFTLKNRKRISARVLDISLGGLAIEMYANYEDENLEEGRLIEHLVFNTAAKDVDADAIIVKKREKFLAFKFTHFYNNSYSLLSRYIMKNISV